MYSSICAGSISPQLASTQRVCGAKNGCSSRNGTSGHRCAALRCGIGPAARSSGMMPAKTASSRGGNLLAGDLLEADPRAAGQLDIDQRLDRAEPDATDHDHVGLDFAAVEEGVHGGQGVLGAGAEAAGSGADENQSDAPRRRGATRPVAACAAWTTAGSAASPSTIQESSSGSFIAVILRRLSFDRSQESCRPTWW